MNILNLAKIIFNRYTEYVELESEKNKIVNSLMAKYKLYNHDSYVGLHVVYMEAKRRGDLEAMADIMTLEDPKRIALFDSVSDLADMFYSLCMEDGETVYEYLTLDPLPDDDEDNEEYHGEICDLFQDVYREIDITEEIKVFSFSKVSIMVVCNVAVPIIHEQGEKITNSMLQLVGAKLQQPELYLVGMRDVLDIDTDIIEDDDDEDYEIGDLYEYEDEEEDEDFE